MYLPEGNARLSYTRSVIRRLALAGFDDLKLPVIEAYHALIESKRSEEDAEEPVDFARTDRIVAGETLGDVVQETRFSLASRDISAVHESPYQDIFANTIKEYTRATLPETVRVHTLFVARIEAHLPPDDPVRIETPALVLAELEAWKTAQASLTTAENNLDLAKKAREKASEVWIERMESVYGLLINRIGKKKAERFFPKIRRAKTPKAPEAAETVAPAPSQTPEAK